jgi:murein L,D-transpeptidase YcbB/YkuD
MARPARAFHALCLTAILLGAPPIDAQISEALRARLEHAAALALEPTNGNPHSDIRDRLVAPELTMKIYQQRDFEPIWARGRQLDLIALVEQAWTHGLNDEDYGLTRLRGLAAHLPTDLAARADVDLAFTDAFVRYTHDLRYGKLDAPSPERNARHDRTHSDMASLLDSLIEAPDLTTRTERSLGHGFLYENLRGWLVRYRIFADKGGWSPVSASRSLRLGDSDPQVDQVRQRLIAEGFAVANAGRLYFDADLEGAVRDFQARYGLLRDGVVGHRTIAAMNVPAETRIDQIRVNLERLRWVTQSWEERLVAVNVAGYRVYYIEGNAVRWSARAVVGRPYRQTPAFRSDLTYLVLNPDWTVPPTILHNDVLPAIRNDRGYLNARQMDVVDYTGRRIDPTTIDWSLYPAQRFPYYIRQRPGAMNELGRIKFVFPNDHLVFLHDTPARNLFEASERVFSSGCIRVERPLELAALLLDAPHWDTQTIDAEVAKGETRTLLLDKPVPIVIVYLTAIAPAANDFNLFADIYERDGALLAGLDRSVE